MPFVEEVIETEAATCADPPEHEVKHKHKRCRLQTDAREVAGTVRAADTDGTHQARRQKYANDRRGTNEVTDDETHADERLREGDSNRENLPVRNHCVFKKPTKPLGRRRDRQMVSNIFGEVGFYEKVALKCGDRMFEVVATQENAQARNWDEMTDVFKTLNKSDKHDGSILARGPGPVNPRPWASSFGDTPASSGSALRNALF